MKLADLTTDMLARIKARHMKAAPSPRRGPKHPVSESAKGNRLPKKIAIHSLSERELKRLMSHAYRPPVKAKRAAGSSASGSKRRWTLEELQLLGKFTDKETARRLGRSLYSARMQRWI